MKILIVASYNRGRFAPFVEEQAEAIRAAGYIHAHYGLSMRHRILPKSNVGMVFDGKIVETQLNKQIKSVEMRSWSF